MRGIELLHPDMPDLLDELLRRQSWSWESVERGTARLGGEPVTLDSLQWYLMCADPVLFCECNLVNRPEDGEGLWTFFDYQKPSLRYRGNVVHQDGAEVGKTREIVSLIAWGTVAVGRGSVLVGSALDGDLDEIWDELQFQIAANPLLRATAGKPTTKPYRRQNWNNGLKTLFRPAGHDGRAYRGVHVRGMLLHDEAAKVVNPVSWSEFWRAGKPDCEVRLYSVPTGDRSCAFQRIADSAVPAEKVVPSLWDARRIMNAALDGGRFKAEARALSRERGGRTWVRWHWPKTIMPAPFWSEERRQQYLEMYGSADSPGYVHNVLGLPGDPEYSVFPSKLTDPLVRHIPDYRTIRLAWDNNAHRVDVLSRRLNPVYSSDLDDEQGEESEREGSPIDPYLTEYRDSVDMSDYHSLSAEERRVRIAAIVRSVVPLLEGDLTAGIDVGSSTVTEINFERTASGIETWVLRISITGFDWYALRDLVLALEDHLHPSGGWGLDATGAGKTLLDILQGDNLDLRDRLSGFIFNVAVPSVNFETGEPQLDPHGKPLHISTKELATQLLERALARRAKRLPEDTELLFLLQNHTYTEKGGTRRYSKVNDHLADSWRCMALRRFNCAFGAAASSPPVTFKALPGRYDSAQLEGFA